MGRLITRRLVFLLPLLFLIHFLGFSYAHVARPLRAARNPSLAALIEPSPLLPTYGEYVDRAFHLDFGVVPGGHTPIHIVVFKAAQASLALLSIALSTGTILGVILGYLATKREPPRTASWLTYISTWGQSLPTFYLGTLFILAMLYITISGLTLDGETPLPTRGFGWDLHLVLPVLTLSLRPIVQIAQVTSGLLVQELRKDYIKVSRGFGHRWGHILRSHAMRNVLAQIILSVSNTSRFVVGELIIVEYLYAWPGIGRMISLALVPSQISTNSSAPMFLDPPVVAAMLTVLAALFLCIDFISIVVVRTVDPRLSYAYEVNTDV
jgi:ABC-type dipeptide/oligopeptide/nickel transport system permease component